MKRPFAPPAPSTRSARISASIARVAAAHDAFGDAPQIFHQHDAQSDGHRPEFANGQRLHALVGADEPAQYFGIETAVVVRDERPGDAEDTRKTFEVTGRELRQFAVKAGRKIVTNFAQLFLNDIKIIDEPFGRGGDGLFVLNGARRGPIVLEKDAAILQHAWNQRPPFLGGGDHELRGRQTFRVLLQALDAEKLGANRLLWLGKNGRRWLGQLSHLLASILRSIRYSPPEICGLRIPADGMKQQFRRPLEGAAARQKHQGYTSWNFTGQRPQWNDKSRRIRQSKYQREVNHGALMPEITDRRAR